MGRTFDLMCGLEEGRQGWAGRYFGPGIFLNGEPVFFNQNDVPYYNERCCLGIFNTFPILEFFKKSFLVLRKK